MFPTEQPQIKTAQENRNSDRHCQEMPELGQENTHQAGELLPTFSHFREPFYT